MNFLEPVFMIAVLSSLGVLCCLGAGLIDIEAGNDKWRVKLIGKGYHNTKKNKSLQEKVGSIED